MLALGIETSTWMGGVALVDDKAGVLAEQILNSRASHSERLLTSIESILKLAQKKLEDCSCVCVSVGPGSFTGVRIGLATAKGLAFATNKPIIGISTLDVLANGLPFVSIPICPIIDARKKEIFAGFYEWHDYKLFKTGPEIVVKPYDLVKKVKKITLFAGDGILSYGDVLREKLKDLALFASCAFNFPRASILAEIGLKRLIQNQISDPKDIVPIYIRPSEAELNWGKD